MQGWGSCWNKPLSVFLALSLLNLLFSSRAVAQPPMVYKNEFLVEPNESSIAAPKSYSKVSNQLGITTLKVLKGGSKLHLVRPKSVGARSLNTSSRREVVPFDPSSSPCPALLKSGSVKSCSPNFQVKISATPNDTALSNLWGMGDNGIAAPGGWDVTTGSSDIVVAVLDTGIDYNHEDLAQNIWINPGEASGNGVDDDGDGFVDDVHGINTITGSGDPFDNNQHGTHVAGTIGAVGNNGVGVVGVNWNVKIMPLKFLDADGSGSVADAIEAIDYMVMMKNRGVNIKVANNSWGGLGYSQPLYDAIKRAGDAGIVFVVAAGNEAQDNDASPSYPASYQLPNVVSVAAIDGDQNIAPFSNYGASTVAIAAPGVDILSTTPGNTYGRLSGTSMATPHVSGALALLFSHEPWLPMSEAVNRLYESGVDLPGLKNLVRTGRKVNVTRLINNINAPLSPAPPESVCNYSIAQIPYTPDTSADGTPIILQADELNFVKFDLPFTFPFHGKNLSTLFISPNGVVYTRAAPSTFDYQNGQSAPVHSIAALQSDLFAAQDPEGVRVKSSSDHATIYWKAKLNSQKSGGDIEIHLTLYPDGRIEDYIGVEDSDVEAALQSAATIGLSALSPLSAHTFAYNSSTIHNRLGIRFIPDCSRASSAAPSPPVILASVSTISVNGVLAGGRLSNQLLPRRSVQVSLTGAGSGDFPISISLNNHLCPITTYATLQNGSAKLLGKLPELPDRITHVTVAVSNSKKVATVKARKKKFITKKGAVSNSQYNRSCQALLASLKSQ